MGLGSRALIFRSCKGSRGRPMVRLRHSTDIRVPLRKPSFQGWATRSQAVYEPYPLDHRDRSLVRSSNVLGIWERSRFSTGSVVSLAAKTLPRVTKCQQCMYVCLGSASVLFSLPLETDCSEPSECAHGTTWPIRRQPSTLD